MDHIAIMKKSWGLTQKILSGKKKIESRWYLNKCVPWNKINADERIYFKDSGDPVTVVATVDKVLQFDCLTPAKVEEILKTYGDDDGIEANDVPAFYERFKDKKYCMLIFLNNPQKIEPFEIDKKGFGAMAAWICTEDVNQIKKHDQ